MDNKAVEKIRKLKILTGRTSLGLPEYSLLGEEGARLIHKIYTEKLGYRKQPSSPPPVLGDEEIRARISKLPNTDMFIPSAYEETSIAWNEFVAQAQRDADVEYYKGGVK